MSGQVYLSSAERNLTEMRALVDERDRSLDQVQQDRDLTDQAKRERATAIREQAWTRIVELRDEVWDDIKNARDRADTALRTGDLDQAGETRMNRAAARVVRMLSGDRFPAEVAEVLAAQGDVTGLRALREEVPAWVTQQGHPNADSRDNGIAVGLEAVDDAAYSLLPMRDREAIDVRRSLSSIEPRLDATLRAALASTYEQRASADLYVAVADGMASSGAT